MSRIDELVERLCPDGVEYKLLGQLARIRNGRDYKHLEIGVVPVYGSGGVLTSVDHSISNGPSVLIPRKGSLGNLFYVDGPFWTVDTIFYTEIGKSLVPKFLFYVLENEHLESLNIAGGVPSLTQTMLNRVRIPVPPLAIQTEIVRILDCFTSLKRELEAELEKELEERRIQYSCYRDRLFDFAPGVARRTLSSVGSFKRGRRFTKNDLVDRGIPAIHYGEIYTRYGVSASSVHTYVNPEMESRLGFASPGDVVIVGVGETVEDVGRGVAWLGDSSIAIHDDSFAYTSELDPQFVSHFLRTSSFNEQKNRYVSRAKVKRLSSRSLSLIEIPVPSGDVQRRVASMLNDFDALSASLIDGIPAEIAARRQQYEYYRDRLLTFKEKAS